MSAPLAPATPVSAADTVYRRRWLILAVMLTAEIMDLLDSTVVNVAGPSLKAELGATPTALQWIIGGYPLALGAGLILGGRLGDRFGRRQLFLVGLIGFTVASLACAVSPSIAVLIVARLVQGLFGALLLPQGLGLIRIAFPPRELGKAFAVFGPVFGLGGILGPVIGGGLIAADVGGLGWRTVFLVNVPIGIAAAIIAWRVLPHGDGDRALPIDVVGAGLVVAASGLLVYPLIQGQEAGWPTWTWVLLAAGLLGYGLFVLQQRRLLAHGRTPLVLPSIFTRRSYTVGLAGIALFFAGLVGVQLTLTLFLQLGHSYGAGEAGLANIPLAVGSGIGGAISGAVLADRMGRSSLQLGAVVQLAGALLTYLLLGGADDFSYGRIVVGLIVSGIGSGLVVAGLFNILLGAVEDHEVGSASGVLSAVQSIASSVGVAVFGTLFFRMVAQGRPDLGYHHVLLLQMGLVVVFLLVSPLFPRRAREHGGPPADSANAP
ncbi:MAG TPA: DHA2 family efflux MFS transporter permease subunit [Friedmanniella sp.]